MRSTCYGFLTVMAIESIVMIFIVHVLTNRTSTFIIITAFIVLFDLLLVYYLIVSLFRSAHRLDTNGLMIRLGTRFRMTVPWQMIAHIKPAAIQVSTKDMLGITLYRKEEALYCMGTNLATHMIALNHPTLVKAPSEENSRSKKGMVTSIFINVDDKDAFEETLAAYLTDDKLAAKSQQPPHEENAPVISRFVMEPTKAPAQIRTGNPLLALQHISYQYGDYIAVDNLSLTLQKGEIFALLGPNGAGKSTTIKMLTGLLKPRSGQILLDGQDIWAKGNASIRRQIGYVPDQPILYFRLSAKEHLYYSGKLLGLEEAVLLERINFLLDRFDLTPYQEQMVETYSQGMQRKVSMCLALLNDPQLLIVDELTNAYDAKTIAVIKKIFAERKAAGKTVLFSAHVMAVTEELADYITIIQKGINYASGTMAELTAKYGSSNLEDLFLELTDAQISTGW